MAKYVLLYHGGSAPESDEERDQVMAAWGKWFEELGEAVIDPGNPFGEVKTIGDGSASGTGGYSVLEAGDHDAAVEMAKGNPMAANDGTRIEVYEALSM